MHALSVRPTRHRAGCPFWVWAHKALRRMFALVHAPAFLGSRMYAFYMLQRSCRAVCIIILTCSGAPGEQDNTFVHALAPLQRKMYLVLRALELLASRVHQSLRAPALLGNKICVFLHALVPFGSRMYAFLHAPAHLGRRMYAFVHDPSAPGKQDV